MMLQDHRRLRSSLIASGYVPLPTLERVCPLLNWSTITPTRHDLVDWERQFPSADTSIRIEGDLVALRICGEDRPLWQLAELFKQLVPILKSAPFSYADDYETYFLSRSTALFGNMQTRPWLGLTPDGPSMSYVEAFGGKSLHLLPAFLAAAERNEDSCAHWSTWPDTLSRRELPLVSFEQVAKLVDRADHFFEDLGYFALDRDQLEPGRTFRSVEIHPYWVGDE